MARTQAKDHSEKREAILQAAAAVFAREGFDGASMATLAREAGISKANIYHYYDSKNALLFDLLESHLSGLKSRVAALPLAGMPPKEQLHAVTREILLAYEGADNAHRVQSAGLALLPPEEQAVLKAHQRALVQIVSDVVLANAPSWLKHEPKKLRDVTMSIFGMLNWFYMWNGGADAEERSRYAETISTLTLEGIGAL